MAQKESSWDDCLNTYVNGFCDKKSPKTAKSDQESCQLNYQCVRNGFQGSDGTVIFEAV